MGHRPRRNGWIEITGLDEVEKALERMRKRIPEILEEEVKKFNEREEDTSK